MARELGDGAAYGDGGVAAAAHARQRGDADERTRATARHGNFVAPLA